MKWLETILLSLGIVFFTIGIYEVIILGFSQAYWSIMMACLFLFAYVIKKKQ